MAEVAAASVVELELWDLADPILRAFGLDCGAWAASGQSSKACQQVLLSPRIAPRLARSLILLLINNPGSSSSPSTGRFTTARALSSVADLLPLMPDQLLPLDPLERVLFKLDVRAAAAGAAADLAAGLEDGAGDGGEQAWTIAGRHSREAEAAARHFFAEAEHASMRIEAFLHLIPVRTSASSTYALLSADTVC